VRTSAIASFNGTWREALQAAAAERGEPDQRLGQAELGVIGSDGEVAGEHDLDPAAQRQPVHRGDHRLKEIEAPRDPGEAARRMIVVAARRALLQIAADAERACPGARDDRDTQRGIGGVRIESASELVMRRGVERVERRRPIDGDGEHGTLALDPDMPIVVHTSPSPASLARNHARLDRGRVNPVDQRNPFAACAIARPSRRAASQRSSG
jgi:hypothetical protein